MMTYKQTLDYLYDQLPMFSKLGKDAIKHDLTNIRKLCEALGNPHEQFKAIHIAGTNGKGSTSHMLSAVLQEAGYKTGLYTSPHLVDFRERIRINGVPVSKEWVVDFVERSTQLIQEVKPSFFEITVAMAFAFFAEEKIDVAVIETGLGGRLDSTNIITPLLSIITNISYDHKDVLGNTLPEIAAEKAGIIKQQVPVLIGEQHPETERIFFEHAVHKQSTVYYAEAFWDLVRVKQDARFQYFKAIHRAKREMLKLQTDLLGTYQRHNIKTVLAAVELLIAGEHFNLSMTIVQNALAKVKSLTGLRGRWDWLQQKPIIIADVGHNPAGIREVVSQWEQVQAEQKHIIIGFVRDKDVIEALLLLPKNAVYYFTNAQIPRALPADELKEKAAKAGLDGSVYSDVASAVRAAKDNMGDQDALLITGSFFIVGEAMEAMNIGMESIQLGLFSKMA